MIDEFRQNSLDFMQNLANPEIGGFFSVMQAGRGGRAAGIVNTVRPRFSKMNIVKWKVSCVAPTVTQTFKLVFQDTNPPIVGDNTFKDVPIGIDPTDVAARREHRAHDRDVEARRRPVYPGGSFKVYGDFCWGGDKSAPRSTSCPPGSPSRPRSRAPTSSTAKRTQQQLIAMGMKGTALEASDTFVEFERPTRTRSCTAAATKPSCASSSTTTRRTARAASPPTTIVQMKGSTAPLPLLLILGSLFGARRGRAAGGGHRAQRRQEAPRRRRRPDAGRRRRLRRAARAAGYGAAAAGLRRAPQGYGRAAATVQPQAPAPQAPPANPYGGGAATTAILTGASGVYTILAGQEVRAGRDAAQCVIALNEPRVSGVHASLKLEGGQLYVRDENSNNGTMVNGNRISPGLWSPVPPGSIVRFGPDRVQRGGAVSP